MMAIVRKLNPRGAEMSQSIPNSPQAQEAWLQVLAKGLVIFPERWWDELGVENGTFIQAKKESNRVVIETQAVKPALSPVSSNAEEKASLLVAQLKSEAQQLEQCYRFRNPEDVWRFLELHPYLVPLLTEAYGHIRKYFPTADLVLEYAPDPEVLGEEQLILSISFEQDVDKAHRALEQFDHDWWSDAGEQAFDDLCVMLGDV
jgi:hypothetical protein